MDPSAPSALPPTSRRPFRAVAYVLAVTAFGAGAPTPLYAIYELRFGFSSIALAAIFAAYTLGVVATMLLVAPLADSVGRRPILVFGMAVTLASALVFLFASGPLVLAIARAVSGLAVGATTGTAAAAMADLEPYRDQHHVARVCVAANFGGVSLGVLSSSLLVQGGWAPTEYVFFVLIAASALGIVAVLFTPETASRLRAGARRLPSILVPADLRRPFWVAAGALASCYALYGLFGALAPTFLGVVIGLGGGLVSGAIIASLFGSASLAQLALGQVRDRRAMLLGFPLLLLGLALLVLGLLLGELALLIAGAVGLGVGIGAAFMGSTTLIDRLAPDAIRAEVLSAFYLVGYLALAVPTIGVAFAAEHVGFEVAATGFSVALGLVVLGLYVATVRTPTPAGGEGRPRARTPGR